MTDIPKMIRVQLSFCSCLYRSDIVGISCLKVCIYLDLQNQEAPDPAGWLLAALCCVLGLMSCFLHFLGIAQSRAL